MLCVFFERLTIDFSASSTSSFRVAADDREMVSKGASCETRQQVVLWSSASDVFVLVCLYCKVSRRTLFLARASGASN